MIQNYPKWFPSGTIKVLHVLNDGPFKILNTLNCNTYVIDILRDYALVVLSMLIKQRIIRILTVAYLIDKPSLKPFRELLIEFTLEYSFHYSREG